MGLSFNLAVIIGLITGFVFGGLLAVAWYLFKRKTRQEKEVCAEDNLTALKSQFPSRRRRRQQLRFVEAVTSPKAQGCSDPDTVPVLYKYSLRPPPHPELQRQTPIRHSHTAPPRNQLLVLVPSTRGRSLRSIDTASIYSTDSAPIDLHDELLQTGPGSGASFRATSRYAPMETIHPSRPSAPVRRLSLQNKLAPETYDKTNSKQWNGYPALDPFYSDKIPRTRVFSGRHKQSTSLLPLYNDTTLSAPLTVKHVVPLLYGRGLSS